MNDEQFHEPQGSARPHHVPHVMGRSANTQALPRGAVAGLAGALALVSSAAAVAASPPPIRTSPANQVPACVTPERLMAFLGTRNKQLLPRFRRIADYYRKHGETWRVRWDYAFYQMAIETNFLTYRQPNGRWGDVNPKQNNFAGIGTTGGGVPGNGFPDVSTGVLAQIQHLVVYSGEQIANPVAPRTRLKQDVILNMTRPIATRRPVTFQDLSGRWAVDKRYGRSIEYVARLFRSKFCTGRQDEQVAGTGGQAARKDRRSTARVTSAPVAKPTQTAGGNSPPVEICKVRVAGSQGSSTLLISSRQGSTVHLTALDVIPGREEQLSRRFISAYAQGGHTIGSFASREHAVAEARAMCKQLTEAG